MTGVLKRVLWPERLRRLPAQFSWVDQALVQRRLIDRCESRAAALYLFVLTVADAQGLSYYGNATLARRLNLSEAELDAARARLIALELLAYEAPLYQVLALPQSLPQPSEQPAAMTGPTPATSPRWAARVEHPQHIGELLAQLERRRDRL
jgi:hypothetical protein